LLKKTAPDVEAVRGIVTGVAQVDHGPVAALRALARLSGPTPDQAITAATALRSAVQRMASAGEEASQRQLDRIDVRKRALVVHHAHGDMPCPVCAGSMLDEEWVTVSQALVKKADAELEALTIAREELERRRSGARGLLTKRPAVLDRAPDMLPPIALTGLLASRTSCTVAVNVSAGCTAVVAAVTVGTGAHTPVAASAMTPSSTTGCRAAVAAGAGLLQREMGSGFSVLIVANPF
jgi:hypothetical protein